MNNGDRTAPTVTAVAALLESLQSKFDWPDQAQTFESVDQWERTRSGTVFFRMIGAPSGPEVLVKIGTGWDQREAENSYRAMLGLADAISDADIEGGHAIRPLAWAPSPPAVVLPYVPGTDLVTLLRQPDSAEWEHMTSWMHRAGALLAAYHLAHATPSNADIAPADEEMLEAGRRMRIPASTIGNVLNQVDWRHRCALSFGDFGPGNLLGTPEGDLYLLDPPEHPSLAVIHKDLGNFLFELRRQLAGRGYTRTRPVGGQFDKFRTELLAGYAEHSSTGLGPCDEALITLFEMRRARGMARKRFPARLGDAIWFAASALARRSEFKRADCPQS